MSDYAKYFRGWKFEAEDMRPEYEGVQVFVTSPCGEYSAPGTSIQIMGLVINTRDEEKTVPDPVIEFLDDFFQEADRELGFS